MTSRPAVPTEAAPSDSTLQPAPEGRPRGAARIRTLWRLFREERENPEPFYSFLATEAVDDLEDRYGPLRGQRIADLGCGPGYYTNALRAAGATVLAVEGDADEIVAGDGPDDLLRGDATRLPVPDASLDGVFCSNMLEHTPDAGAVAREIARVLRPGGWCYLSWTNWYSPWGGHDMTPYQFLGPRRGPVLYERRHGPPRKNRYGEGLFAVHIGPTLRTVEAIAGLRIDDVEPRYWPWAKAVTRVPGVREVLTWNCVIRMTREDDTVGSAAGAKRGPTDSSTRDPEFDEVLMSVADVEGWMSDGQARRLWDRARALEPGSRIVEIGSFRGRSAIVLGHAAAEQVEVVAIDPHAGNDRGPSEWSGPAEAGQGDHEIFLDNLERAGVAGRVRYVREFSRGALDAVKGPIDMLYVDGSHRPAEAAADIRAWGARVRLGGTLLVHDTFSSAGVTLAVVATLFAGGDFRYVGRVRSMAEYRRENLSLTARLANALRQSAQFPWMARNLLAKFALWRRIGWLTRLLGYDEGDAYPY